jgi:hypothetical protein
VAIVTAAIPIVIIADMGTVRASTYILAVIGTVTVIADTVTITANGARASVNRIDAILRQSFAPPKV